MTLILACAVGYWWLESPKPWTDKAISAKFNELSMQQVGEQLNFTFQYTLTNNTSREYTVPATGVGVLMRQIPEKGGFDRVDEASWDTNLVIPPRQTMNVRFVIPYKFADYDTSAQEMTVDGKGEKDPISGGLVKFAGRRLKDIDGFAFFDYSKKYRILLSNGWKDTQNK